MAVDSRVNLSDVNVARRLRFGIVALAAALAGALVCERLNVARGVRLFLFVPFFVFTNSFFQAMYMTCGWSAFAGKRHTPRGAERIADRHELRSVRARGLRQIGLAFLGAAALTTSFLLI